MNRAEEQRDKEKNAKIVSEKIYQGRVIEVHRETYEFTDIKPLVCDLVIHPGAVAVIPIAEDGRLLLIRQWRQAAQEILIEIPAGVLEKDEAIDRCADRELREETGYRAKELIPLGAIFTAPGFCNEKIYLFLARGLEEAPLPPDLHEAIDLCSLPLSEALDWIETGKITDAKTIVGILRYSRMKI